MTAPSPAARRPHLTAPARLAAVLLLCALAAGTGPRGPDAPGASTGTPLLAVARESGWSAPVDGASPADVLRGFAAPDRPWGRGHRGVDLAAPPGAPVLAPAAGQVVFAGVVVDRPVVTLEHADGTRTSFEPVEAEAATGARLARGEQLGRVAAVPTHCARPCVHWGVREPGGWRVGQAVFDRYLDPLVLIGWSGPSVLWPHDEPGPARP